MDLERLKSEFVTTFGGNPRIFRAPGRVNLIGEHTDHDLGFVFPMAIDRAVYVAAAASDSGIFRVRSLNENETIEIDLASDARQTGWGRYIEGVARILRETGREIPAVDMVIESDVPVGAGLSSSAALETAVGLALTALAGETIDRVEMAKIGQRTEHEYVGVECGIMDQFVSANAVAGHALLIDCLTLESAPFPLPTDRYEVVICDTRVKHDLVTSAYNDRKRDYEAGIVTLRRWFPDLKHLRELKPSDFEAHAAEITEPSRRRARHVVTENARCLEAARLLGEGDLASFGALMWESHASLRDDYEVSCPELDFLVECAREFGDSVLGSRMTGGGFGGSTVSLVARDSIDEFKSAITAAFEREFGHAPGFIVSEPASGAGEIES